MREIQNFVWDFDGTLFDTYPVIIDVLREGLRQFGYDCQPQEAMKLLLENLTVACNRYAEEFSIDFLQLKKQVDVRWKKRFSQLESKPMADIEKVLKKICAEGKKNYIFTNRNYAETVAPLKAYGLAGFFEDIIGQDSEGFAWKPAPDALIYLMEKHSLEAKETVMIGDRLCDLESGRSAGTKTAHIVCQMVPEELDCDWRIESYGQMLELL